MLHVKTLQIYTLLPHFLLRTFLKVISELTYRYPSFAFQARFCNLHQTNNSLSMSVIQKYKSSVISIIKKKIPYITKRCSHQQCFTFYIPCLAKCFALCHSLSLLSLPSFIQQSPDVGFQIYKEMKSIQINKTCFTISNQQCERIQN